MDVLVVVGVGGMGETIARRQAVGRKTVLADFNEVALEATAEKMRVDGFDVVTAKIDVSSRESVERVAALAASLGPVAQVVHTELARLYRTVFLLGILCEFVGRAVVQRGVHSHRVVFVNVAE